MKRENRYLVFKRKDMLEHLTPEQQSFLEGIAFQIELGRKACEKSPIECVVVEHDWPMYEDTWQAIEQWVEIINASRHRIIDRR